MSKYKARAVNKQHFELFVEASSPEDAFSKALGIDMEDWIALGDSQSTTFTVVRVEDDELPEEIKPSHWDEIAAHPVSDWQLEVANNDTRLGYLAWVEAREHDEYSD